MITLPNNDDTRPRRKYGTIKLKVKKPWEVSTGHKEYRDTTMDSRPKRRRTRRDIDKEWQQEYDM